MNPHENRDFFYSKDKKANMVGKFQEKAKKEGIEVPAVFSQIDYNTGLPAVLAVKKEEDEGESDEATRKAMLLAKVEETIQKAEVAASSKPEPVPPPPPPPSVMYDGTTQTDDIVQLDESVQTLLLALLSRFSGTNNRC